MTGMTDMDSAVMAYCRRHGLRRWKPMAALIDMDGVLYDSMPLHAAAWKRMTEEEGMDCCIEEFFLYEGMTGAATVNLLFRRHKGREATPREIEELYARKARYFRESGKRIPMPGAAAMLRALEQSGLRRVLVTGSAQSSLLNALDTDYPGAFLPDMRVTAHDVHRGKPDPEPYLMGLKKAGVTATEAIVIENAPLGVEAGHKSGCFTVGLTTGPVPAEALRESGADIVVESMPRFAEAVDRLIVERYV